MNITTSNNTTDKYLEPPEYLPKTMHHKKCWFGTDESKNKKYILTVSGKNDRFGSQYSAQMSGFVFARRHNCIYRFSAFLATNSLTWHPIFVA